METRIALFQQQQIRKIFHKEEWWFSIVDVVGVLSDSSNPNRYWSDLKITLSTEAGSDQPYEKIVRLKLRASDGKQRDTDCANTETLLRIIQSVPSPKAEPFKRWLAEVGYDRIKEIEDPERATQRTRALYQAKGYSDAWIEKRLRGIAIREELTGEWKKRGVDEKVEYGILTAEISKAAFGFTPAQYKRHKGLKRQNLRDHMSSVELVFSMLGEAATTEIARAKDAQGFPQNKEAAVDGGTVAGNARRELEKKSGRGVVSQENYLEEPESVKRKRLRSP